MEKTKAAFSSCSSNHHHHHQHLLPVVDNQYKCKTCFKIYSKKDSLQKHAVLCEFSQLTQKEREIEAEECGDKPTYDQLVGIVQQLCIEHKEMKTKIQKLEHTVSLFKSSEIKLSKKNTLALLNSSADNNDNDTSQNLPSIPFKYWVEILLTDTDVITDDVLLLLETKSIQEVVIHIISKHYSMNVECHRINPLLVIQPPQQDSKKGGGVQVYLWENEWMAMTEEILRDLYKEIVEKLRVNIMK